MCTQDSTPFQAARHSGVRLRAFRRDDFCPRRVIVGPPIGEGRIAYVQQLDTPHAPTQAPEIVLSVHGRRFGGCGEELLLSTAVRRCDLWNGDFDERLDELVRWHGWTVTRLERREVATASA